MHILRSSPSLAGSDASLAPGKSFFFPIPSMRSVVFHWTRRHGNWPCGGARGDCARLEELADVGPSSRRDTRYASSYFLLQCALRSLFFFFSVLLAVVFLIFEELCRSLSLSKEGLFFIWVGGVAYVENFPFLLSPLWQLATCLFLWGHSLSPERHIVSRTSAACRITGAKSADPHFRHSF